MQGEDETALEILYNRYAGLIFTLALRIVGDPELAREVLQDTFLRCWDGRETYDVGRGRVPWWLMGIARNRAIDLLRSRPHQARLREREPLAVVIAKATQPDVTDSFRCGTPSSARYRACQSHSARPSNWPTTEGLRKRRSPTSWARRWERSRLLEQYRGVVGALPLGLDPVSPPAEAWGAIRAEVARRRPRGPGRARIKGLPDWRRTAWPVLGALAASLLVWNVMLQLELTHRPPGPEVEALARRPGRLVILTGTGAPGASGRLLVAIDGHHGHLATAGLGPLAAERTYQLWFVRPGAPTAAGGTFRVDSRGRAWATITVPISLDDARVIAVTEEPAPGSAAPTGRYLLEARAWR